MKKEIYDARSDSEYQKPYIDVDETRRRTMPDGSSMPYRYVHGGFQETKVKFSFCFPPREQYRGRFYQYLCPFPGPDEELASLERKGEDDTIAFCLENGAYFIETNMGSASAFGGNPDPKRVWKSSAAAAEYSRTLAMEYYGCKRPYGYVFGGSGGGYKTIACIENTNAWDGACPYVIGSPYSLPNTITMHVQGMRTLRHVFPKIIDALDAGGSGDMYEGLTEEEASMLKELTLMGVPPLAWFMEAAGRYDDGSLPVLLPGVKQADPQYFQDFWEAEGYLGAEPGSSARRDRLQFEGVVKAVHGSGQHDEQPEKEAEYSNGVDTAWKKQLADGGGAWMELEKVPKGEDLYLKGVSITFRTGKAAGKQLLLGDIVGNGLTIGMCFGMDDVNEVLAMVEPGDRLTLDNSDYIAVQSYYRHQVPPDTSFHAWDQFRDENGKPTLPQRDKIMGPGFCGTGTVQEGTIQGKVILTQALMDESTCPWCGDWYRSAVRRTKGSEDDFRIYYYERCLHGDVSALDTNMIVNYLGGLRQALMDISDWVERGIEPAPSSRYQMDGGSVRIAGTAEERGGLQPVIRLTANGEVCAHVKTGETVMLEASAKVPEGAGEVTEILFSVSDPMFGTCAVVEKGGDSQAFLEQGRGERMAGILHPFEEDGRKGAVSDFQTSYDRPGTYFATAFVKSERYGRKDALFTQVKNLARVRIVVEG